MANGPLLQIRLSTLLILTLESGFLMFMNAWPRTDPTARDSVWYGWPTPLYSTTTGLSEWGLAFDAFVGLALVTASLILTDRLIFRNAHQASDLKQKET